MPPCFFASDLHGHRDRYRALFRALEQERPAALFLGGDLLPNAFAPGADGDFIRDFLVPGLRRAGAVDDGRRVFLIPGNDDPRFEEASFLDAAAAGAWEYVQGRGVPFAGGTVCGYAYVPPSPFLLKDWERYDVSRYVDPGAVSPEEGRRTVPVSEDEAAGATIAADLERLAEGRDPASTIFLFHGPPYRTVLDRAALDGRFVDHVPLDVHVGSIAQKRFIEARGPRLTLHGHVHESVRLTGAWRERIGPTHLFGAAHDGPELALVRFDPEDLEAATRTLEPVDP